jgi:DNA-binding winged helix-turn-helix (wHTH) protein
MNDRVLVIGLDAAHAPLRAAGRRVVGAWTPDEVDGVAYTAAVIDGSAPWAAAFLADHRARGRHQPVVVVGAFGASLSRLADARVATVDEAVSAVADLTLVRAPRWLTVGDRLVDLVGQRVLGGPPATLTEAECTLLAHLAAAGESGLTREQLGRALGLRVAVGRSVDHSIARLRSKLDRDRIRTVRGAGYALDARVLEGPPALMPSEPPPAPPAPYVGGEPELERMMAAWAAGASLIAVAGPPGCGKSSLARKFAAQVGEVGWLDLASGHVPPVPSGVALLDDNDLVGPALAAAIGPRIGKDLRVIWTSREPPPLSTAVVVTPPPWSLGQAQKLASGRVPPEPELDDLLREVLAVAGGAPLAVELALARLRVVTASELRQRLVRDPGAALGDPARRPARHRRWADVIAWPGS